jgi:L1 cell adhesion molecule like protein
MADVKATNGDTHLGGQDFTNCIVDHCVERFQANTGTDIRNDKKALTKLRAEAEKCKLMLSKSLNFEMNVDCLKDDEDFCLSITKSTFEKLCAAEFAKILPCV